MRRLSIKVLPYTTTCNYQASREIMSGIIKSMAERVSPVWFVKLWSRELRWVGAAHIFVRNVSAKMTRSTSLEGHPERL